MPVLTIEKQMLIKKNLKSSKKMKSCYIVKNSAEIVVNISLEAMRKRRGVSESRECTPLI